MSKPMFLFAGSYDSLADAEADYEVVKALHSAGDIGSYDSNIISKGPGGKVTVTKTEKPAQHGAWIGLAAGAAASVVFPFLLPGVIAAGAGGAGIGAWIGHLAHGTSRSDAKEIGALLDEGTAVLIVVGVDKDAEAIEKAAEKSTKQVLKQVDGDFEEAEREVNESIKQTT
jgi:uncharacterized membrane protein